MHNAKVDDSIVVAPARASNADNEGQKACRSSMNECVGETMGSTGRVWRIKECACEGAFQNAQVDDSIVVSPAHASNTDKEGETRPAEAQWERECVCACVSVTSLFLVGGGRERGCSTVHPKWAKGHSSRHPLLSYSVVGTARHQLTNPRIHPGNRPPTYPSTHTHPAPLPTHPHPSTRIHAHIHTA